MKVSASGQIYRGRAPPPSDIIRGVLIGKVAIFKASKEAANGGRLFAAAPACRWPGSSPHSRPSGPALPRTIDPVLTEPNGITSVRAHTYRDHLIDFIYLKVIPGEDRWENLPVCSPPPSPLVLFPHHVLETFRPKKSCHG